LKHPLFWRLCVAGLLAWPAAAAGAKPNIVLVMADDMGWGDVGFNGNTVIRTPHLDELAKAGLRFTRFYSGAPVCSPTRGSVVTGRHPFRYGIYFANVGHMKPEEITLAELLGRLGYTTGHFGKWHLGTLTKTVTESNRGGPRGVADYSPPWDNGFDVCFSTEAKVPTWDPMWKPAPKAPHTGWDYIQDLAQAVPYGTHYWSGPGQMVTRNLRGDDSRVIMDRAVPFIERAVNNGKPFFAIIWFHAPHLPVVAGPNYARMYSQYPTYTKNYYGAITALDDQVGRLRATLEKLGVSRNTMLWFCSDNGPEGKKGQAPGSAGPFRGRKRSLYEGGVRVPGVVVWPEKVPAGGTTDFPAVTSDYLPTIIDVLGMKMPDGRPIDGISLLPLLEGNMRERPKPIGFESKGQISLNDNRYKLIRPAKDAPFELYDLIADPAEAHNIAAEHPELVKKMKATLKSWRRSCQRSNAGADYPH